MRRFLTLLAMFLVFAAGSLVTTPNIDSHGYWALGHTRQEIQWHSELLVFLAKEDKHFPTESEGLSGIFQHPFIDHWGRPYIYKVLDLKAQKFVIYSAGPDGIDNGGGGDDVIGGEKQYKCELYGACKTVVDYANYALSIATLLTLLTGIILAGYSVFKWITRRRARAVSESEFQGPVG